MVLSFINLENGVTFDGNPPYEFWFDEGQSVNLIYTKRIAFLSDSEYETVSTAGDDLFFLIDTIALQNTQQVHIGDEDYFDLDLVSTQTIQSTGVSYSSNSSNFIHSFIICCRSEEAGQFKSIFTVGGTEYNIGADFYNEDERLSGNLENLGIEIPETVQKAIYESNVHEEATDNILMNRKWKELLLEYWRIVACKGSYRSLVSSLKWFEYGELVKILEYWKREDVGRTVLISNDIEQILSDLFREQLSVLSKTTYIGLYLALETPDKTKRDDDIYPFFASTEVYSTPSEEENPDSLPTVLYSSGARMLNENNPVLERISSVWSAQDLMLKMTLVGNFFSTYFMPIHLDLIHSTVENIVFTNAMKVMAGGMQAREDWIYCGGTFRCTSFTDGADFYMQPIDAEVGPLTILGLKDDICDFSYDPGSINEENPMPEQEYVPTVLGYNIYRGDTTGNQDGALSPSIPADESTNMDIMDILFAASNRYEAYGAPVRFDIEIPENVQDGDFLRAVQIHWRRNGTELFDYRDAGIYVEPIIENGSAIYRFSFNILIERDGKYDMSLIFESSKGIWYSKKFTVNVLDNADNHISIYKITRGDIDQWKDTVIEYRDGMFYIKSEAETEICFDVNDFMFSAIEDFTEMRYAQFIQASGKDFSRSVGLNHVIIIPTPVPNNGTAILKYKDDSASLAVSAATEAQLNATFPNYWWIVRETDIWMENENTTENRDATYKGRLTGKKSNVIIGIRKYFTTDSADRVLAKKTYKIGSHNYEVTITQVGNMARVNVRNLTGAGTSKYYRKLTDEIEVNILGKHKTKIHVHPDCTPYPSNKNSELGTPEKRIVVEKYSSRIVDEDRFVPLFHKLEPITSENWDLEPGEACLAVPHFHRTQQDKIDELSIYFTHCGTAYSADTKYGEAAKDDSNGEPTKIGITLETNTNQSKLLVAEYKRSFLKRGYYDVVARYKYNGKWHTEKQAGAFRIC